MAQRVPGEWEGNEVPDEEENKIDRLWSIVEESAEDAMQRLDWDVDFLMASRGYVPGLRLLKAGETGNSTMLSADQSEIALKEIVDFKVDGSSEIKVPKISRDNWNISGEEHFLKLLPGYIETNAGIVIQAIHQFSLGAEVSYKKRKIELEGEVAAAREKMNGGADMVNISGFSVGDVEKKVAETVSGIRLKQSGWQEKVQPFLQEYISDELTALSRIGEHFVWAPEVVEVLQMSLGEVKDAASYTYCMQNALRLNHNIMMKQKAAEEKLKVSESDEEKVLLAFAVNVYADCLQIIDIYGSMIRKDGSQKGYIEERTSKFDKEQWKNERQEMLNRIKMFSFDAQVLGVTKLIKEIDAWLSAWEGQLSLEEMSTAQYNRDLLVCDQKALEISRKFFEGEVLTEFEVQVLRGELGAIELERKILDIEKSLLEEGDSMTEEVRRTFERDLEILKKHREISLPDQESDRREMLIREGTMLLLSREHNELKARLEDGAVKLSDKDRHNLQCDVDGLEIDLKIMEIESEIDRLSGAQHEAKKRALIANRNKLGNAKRILEIDRKLNAPGLAWLSATETEGLQAKKALLKSENELIDLEVLMMGNNERIKDVRFYAGSIMDFCEILRSKGEQFVSIVRRGSELIDDYRKVEEEFSLLEVDYNSMESGYNQKIQAYRDFADMVKLGDAQLAQARESGKNMPAYPKIERRVGSLRQQMETLKNEIAAESAKLNESRNKMQRVAKAKEVIGQNMLGLYRDAINVRGSGTTDAGTIIFVLNAIRMIMQDVAKMHISSKQVTKGINQVLVDEISLAHEQKRSSGIPHNPESAKAVSERTMMSIPDATYYPLPKSSEPRVQVIESPESYRHTFNAAVGDLVFGNKKDQ